MKKNVHNAFFLGTYPTQVFSLKPFLALASQRDVARYPILLLFLIQYSTASLRTTKVGSMNLSFFAFQTVHFNTYPLSFQPAFNKTR